MKFERLDTQKHHRKDFDCGVIALNLYLQQVANQDQKRGLTRAFSGSSITTGWFPLFSMHNNSV